MLAFLKGVVYFRISSRFPNKKFPLIPLTSQSFLTGFGSHPD